MSENVLDIDFSQPEATVPLLPCPPLLSSHQSGWNNIHLASYQLPPWEVPEIASPQHTIAFLSCKRAIETEVIVAGKVYHIPRCESKNHVGVFPADVPIAVRWEQEIEFTHCYLESKFLNHIAYESVNPDRVEIMLALPPKFDPLVWQIGLSLKTLLENDPRHSCLYAESMATALAAHFLRFYSTRAHVLREYKDGLPKSKLKRSIEYIHEHLHENLTLTSISSELGMSQYYLCQLFKQSVGITPHAYIVQQRVELSKRLLKQKQGRIIDIAIECGFANPSHFARCFRQQMGISPKQFRQI